jgi:hypothetical protein
MNKALPVTPDQRAAALKAKLERMRERILLRMAGRVERMFIKYYGHDDNQRVNVLAKLLAAAIACRYECNSETAYIVLAVIIRSFDADRANCEEVSA